MLSTCLLLLSCRNISGFVHSSKMMIKPLSKNAPIVIADECVRLNSKLKEIRDNKAGFVLFDYKINNESSKINVDTMKRIHEHSKMIADKQSYIQEKFVYRIINFSYHRDRYVKVECRYNEDVQNINILRAFVSGMYLQEVHQNRAVTSWNNLEKVNRIIENKYRIPRRDQFLHDMFFFSTNAMLYKDYMIRNDTMRKEYFDTSRHLLIYDDLYLEKHMDYIYKVNNPIGIKVTGKVRINKIMDVLSKLKARDEIILIMSFHKLISLRRLFPRLIESIQQTRLLHHNVNICFEINSYNKKKYGVEDIDKDVDFIFNMKRKYNIHTNIGLFLRFSVSDHEITVF